MNSRFQEVKAIKSVTAKQKKGNKEVFVQDCRKIQQFKVSQQFALLK